MLRNILNYVPQNITEIVGYSVRSTNEIVTSKNIPQKLGSKNITSSSM